MTVGVVAAAMPRRRPAPIRLLVPAVCLTVGGGVLALAWGDPIASWWNFRIGPWVESVQEWITFHRNTGQWLFRWVLDPTSRWLHNWGQWTLNVLHFLTWPGVVALVLVVAWRVSGRTAALTAAGAAMLVGCLGLWEHAMQTVAFATVSVAIAIAIGVPFGIYAAHHRRFEQSTRVVLDAMQVMPAFCYLLPMVLLFDIGVPAAVIATVVFALPAAVRLTLHGIRGVPVEMIEVGVAHGGDSRQVLTKVELPLARPALLLGVNQTINLALGIVVIAALVGAEGLGHDIVDAVQHILVGQAFDAGLAIVAVAVVFDRLTCGRGEAAARAYRRAQSPSRTRRDALIGIATVALVVVVAKLAHTHSFPTWMHISFRAPVDSVASWTHDHLRTGLPIIGGTAAINDFTVIHVLDPMRDLFTNPPWWATLAGVCSAAWALAGRRVAAVCAVGLLLVAALRAPGADSGSIWYDTFDTLSQVLLAVAIAMSFAIPIGIAAGRSRRFFAVIRPLLDAMQVMPSFVYLVPVIALFPPGRMPGVIASVIYALPPAVRLTALGIHEVPVSTIEAAESVGATRWQMLTRVQLPQAWRSIMLGMNQTILMVLSMVIISGLVGGGALGLDVVYGLTKSELGLGVEAGIAIVALAVILDRITQGLVTGMRSTTKRE